MSEFGVGGRGGEEGGRLGRRHIFFVTDGQKCDYLSRASLTLLRGGATKNGFRTKMQTVHAYKDHTPSATERFLFPANLLRCCTLSGRQQNSKNLPTTPER